MSECSIRKHKDQRLDLMYQLALLILLCMHGVAKSFNLRSDAVIGVQLCTDVMEKFGLIAHAGKDSKESKTKAVFFLSLRL